LKKNPDSTPNFHKAVTLGRRGGGKNKKDERIHNHI
jgi:hypothetical protein